MFAVLIIGIGGFVYFKLSKNANNTSYSVFDRVFKTSDGKELTFFSYGDASKENEKLKHFKDNVPPINWDQEYLSKNNRIVRSKGFASPYVIEFAEFDGKIIVSSNDKFYSYDISTKEAKEIELNDE